MLSEEWSDRSRVAEYLAREIPHRAVAEEMLLQALPEQVSRFVDLGTGDGRLLALVQSRYPEAEGTGLDSSAPMLDRARERFGSNPRVVLREHDLELALPLDQTVDAVVSGLAIHHLEDVRKRKLFAEIHGFLSPAESSRISISCARRQRVSMSAFAKRSAVPRTIRRTDSLAWTNRWNGFERLASPRWNATSSGLSSA
jgi:SAM-dependent methyltransferase